MKNTTVRTYFTLKNPLRLVIDLNNTSDTAKLSGIENSGDLIKKLRYSTPKNKSSARVVVELNRNTKPSLFAVTPDGAYGHRLVVDLPDSAPKPSPTLSASASTGSVVEEVGVKVKNLRYYNSQPWPFPHSLMVGFVAEYDEGEIRCQENEIDDAQWFDIDALPTIPPKVSIAGQLIAETVSLIGDK